MKLPTALYGLNHRRQPRLVLEAALPRTPPDRVSFLETSFLDRQNLAGIDFRHRAGCARGPSHREPADLFG